MVYIGVLHAVLSTITQNWAWGRESRCRNNSSNRNKAGCQHQAQSQWEVRCVQQVSLASKPLSLQGCLLITWATTKTWTRLLVSLCVFESDMILV